MTFKANIDAQVRGFYFAESGNDDFDGATFERPKLTIQAAIDEALALDPIPQVGNVALVTVAQGGSFDETVVMSDWIQFNAEDVTITSAASVLIDLASFLSFRISGAINTQAGGTCFEADGVQSLGLESLFMASSGIGLNITGACDDLFFTISRVNISAIGSVGINITSSTVSPIDININTVSMDANDTTFIVYEPVSGITSMKISTISFDGATGTTIAECKAGNLVISGDVMQAETFSVMTNAAQLTVSVQVITGDTILNGTSAVTFKPVTQYIGNLDVNDTATLFGDMQIFFGNLDMEAGTNAIFNCGFMTGDLNIEGTLFCHINSHIGAITGSGTINGLINGVAYGTYIQRPVSNVIFVHENGDDSNSGLVPDTPLQTIGAAITLASTLLPTSINQVLIEIIDNGTYAETIELPSFVSLIGENAIVNGRITVLDNTILKLKRAENSNSSQPVIRKTSGTGFSDIKVTSLVVVGNNQEGVLCSSGMIDFTTDFVEVDAGTGIKAKLGAEILFSVGEVSLTNSGHGLGTRTSDGGANKLIGFVRDATDDGTGTLIETRVPGDVINIQGGTFNVNTLFDIGETGTLNAFANEANGARIAHATATVNITNHSSDSRHAGNFSLGGVYQSDQATLILDDKTIDTTGGSAEDNFVLRYGDSAKQIELQPGYSIEKVVLNGFDTNNQVPVGTDNPLQVTFGAAQFGPSDPVELSAAGAITINQSDQYNMLIVFQYGRTGAAGGSTILFFRVLVNGAQFGRSLYADLDNPNQAFPVEFTTPVDLVATDVLTVEIWRDSLGFDAGELIPKTPTLGGTNSSPSAAITLTRNRLVQPV